MLKLNIENLKNKKNLLAFSAGVDSSALFFLLLENDIKFDIAIVNYGTREESDKEEAHAKALAKKHKLYCHSIKAPVFHSHFEKQARDFRYEFFESLITIEGYDTLITAHQLNDQLEWLLMRLSKGAGLSELLGLEPVTKKRHYALIRPLLSYSKEELLAYLQANGYPYFVDESNTDESYERNKFRKHFSDALIAQYKEGIQRSMAYLRKDKEVLESGFETLYSNKLLYIVKLHTPTAKVKAADITLKKLGYLLSAKQRQEIEKESSLVIGGTWSVALQDDLLFIAPYLTADMPKKFKELCRVLNVPDKIRPYLFKEHIDPSELTFS
jgi:tRNA(Ile)-lysidine synthase